MIYVYSDNNGNQLYERAKGMDATKNTDGETSTSITNQGKIYVEGGTGMMVTNAGDPNASGVEVLNENEITVINSGYGMSLGSGDASNVKMTNTGTIHVSGEHATGITQSDANNGVLKFFSHPT